MACESLLRLKELYVYPVKSCSAAQIESLDVARTGLKYDRCWVITDAKGVYINYKDKLSQLYWIKPSFDFENAQLCLDYEGMETLKVPLEVSDDTPVTNFRLFKDRFPAYDCGDEAAAWFDEVFQEEGHRLVRQTPEILYGKLMIEDKLEKISFNNKSQYLMVCNKSMEWLVDQLNEKYDLESSDEEFWTIEKLLYRFRVNFYTVGTTKAFEEETWNELELCGVKLKVHGPCVRCSLINVSNNDTAEIGKEPMQILDELRPAPCSFGIYMGKDDENIGTISVGCTVNVLKSTLC